MALGPELIIDADSHVTEPADVWTARVPAKYKDDVPRVVRTVRSTPGCSATSR